MAEAAGTPTRDQSPAPAELGPKAAHPMADGEQMELSSLPDDLTRLVLQLCTVAALLSLEATCHRMKGLLQPPGAWRLPCDVHSLVGDDNQRAAAEAVHAVRTGHVARALVQNWCAETVRKSGRGQRWRRCRRSSRPILFLGTTQPEETKAFRYYLHFTNSCARHADARLR